MKHVRKRVYIIRHAHAPVVGDDGIVRHCPGHPLSEEGRFQADKLAKFLKSSPIESIWSSDIRRTRETAERVGEELGLDVKIERGLREFSIGILEGKHITEVQSILKDMPGINEFRELNKNDRFPEGESMEDLERRVVPVFEKIIMNDDARNICVVAHGGVNRILLIKLLGLPYKAFIFLQQDPACVNVVDIVDGKAFLQLLNFTPYDPWKENKEIRLPTILD